MDKTEREISANPVLAPIEREKAAMAAGDPAAYFPALTEDAIFLPPQSHAKSGEELRSWLAAFMRDFRIEWLSFVSTELEVVESLAYHTFTYQWRATPRAGGEGTVASGKGLHVLRRQADGCWKIAREIWNALPGS